MKLLSDNWQKFEDFLQKKDTGLKTYFPDIDRLLIGLPGLCCLQGEPKSCKSTVALNIMIENAKRGTPVLLYDFENGQNRTRLRALSYLSGLTVGVIRSLKFSEQEAEAYYKARGEIEALPFYYESSIREQGEIESAIKEIGAIHKKPLLVVIDSVQRLVRNAVEARADINGWWNHFNDLKLRYEKWATFIIISEKNRASYGKGAKGGAKESGEAEYLAEVTLDLYPTTDETQIVVECVYSRDTDMGLMTKINKPTPFNFRLNSDDFIGDK